MSAGRERRRPPVLTDFLPDLGSAARALRREPGFVLAAVTALAVGVGSTATVFGMANRFLLRPVTGVTDPGRAAYLELVPASGPDTLHGKGIALPDFDELRAGATLLTGLASYGFATHQVSAGDGLPVEVLSGNVYGDFFEVLGVRPASGRLLRADETGPAADPRVAVIGQELGAKLFGEAADVAGRTLQVDGQSVTVLGVAGDGFQGPLRSLDVQMWLPHSALVAFNDFPPEVLTGRRSVMHGNLVARLPDDVASEAAEAQVMEILGRLARAHPEDAEYLRRLRPRLSPGLRVPPTERGRIQALLGLFGGAVALVLLIACANVATLLLVRNVARRSAVATRRALGASPGRIARAHLAESALLAVLGSLVGLAVARLVALPFRGERLPGMPAFGGFAVDVRVLGFAVAAAAATAVLFGAAPAALAGRFDLAGALRAGGGADTPHLAGLRRLMTAGQVAVSITLLVGAALLVRTVRNLYAVDTGLAVNGVATLSLGALQDPGDPAGSRGVYRDLLDRVRRLPGVEGAALDMKGPLGPASYTGVALPDAPTGEVTRAVVRPVTPDWFGLLDVAMVRGRPFADADREPGAPVPVVVTASLARRLFGGTDVIGRSLRVSLAEPEAAEVVGVSEDLRVPGQLDRPQDAFFVPLETFPVPSVVLVARARDLDAPILADIRRTVESVVPGQAVREPAPLSDALGRGFTEQRVFLRLLGLLSALAVVLSAVGLYSVIAFAVAQRTRDLGIRMALGAGGTRVARLVLGEAAAIVAAGTAAGLTGAYVLSRMLESRLFGVGPVDVPSYAAAVLLFAAVAALACWRPVRIATRVDPAETLRV